VLQQTGAQHADTASGMSLCRRRILFQGLPSEQKPEEADAADQPSTSEASSSGMDDAALWPTSEQLRRLLVCRPGRPVATADIEGDVVTLLSTGLFARGRPAAAVATREQAVAFGLDGTAEPGGEGVPGRRLTVPAGAACSVDLRCLRRLSSVQSGCGWRMTGVAATSAVGSAPGWRQQAIEATIWVQDQWLAPCSSLQARQTHRCCSRRRWATSALCWSRAACQSPGHSPCALTAA
jgi:hypothetical protein